MEIGKPAFTVTETIEKFSPDLEDCIVSVIENENYIKYETNKNKISTNGGNYLGDLFTIDIKGETQEGEKETNLFIKRIICGGSSMLSTSAVHFREIFFYKDLCKVYEDLQDEYYVPQSDRFETIKFYDGNSEALIFENMAKKGFKTYDRMETVSLKFAKLSIQQLARFHGLSFVLLKKRPIYFDRKIKSLKYPMKFNEEYANFFSSVFNIVLDHLEEEEKKRLQKMVPVLWEKILIYLQQTPCCLCYGDFRTNNILVREKDGEAIDVVPIDYQAIYFGNPVNDLLYFIFGSTDREFRKRYMEELKAYYYDELTHFLEYFDNDVKDVYPRKDFENEFVDRLDYGLISFVMLCPFLFACEDSMPDIKGSFNEVSYRFDSKAEKRIREIVKDFIEWGYL